MRKYLSFVFISFVILLLSSCQQEVTDPNGSSNPPAVTGDFKAKIEGTQWVANKSASASRTLGRIAITGLGNDKKTIAITLTDSGVHRYILSDVTLNAAAYQDSTLPSVVAFTSNGGTYPTQSGGEVNITSIDTSNKKMSGTFFFKVYRQIDGLQRNITEGSFTNISYTTSISTGGATDTFRVKIAGTQWNPPSIVAVKAPAFPPIPATISVSGIDPATSKQVSVVLPADVTAGTFPLVAFPATTFIGTYMPDSNPLNIYSSTVGTVTIISHNTTTKRIIGSFSFLASQLSNPLSIANMTEGYFSVTYL